MTLTKSSIKKADLVAMLENLRDYAYLSSHEQDILKSIGKGYIDLVLKLNTISGIFKDTPILKFGTTNIYRLKPGTTLKQLREACFPKPEKVEPRFWEYDVYVLSEGNPHWLYDGVNQHKHKVLIAMNERSDFAGLKYGNMWYMDRQIYDVNRGEYTHCVNSDVAASIVRPSMIRFKNDKFKESK